MCKIWPFVSFFDSKVGAWQGNQCRGWAGLPHETAGMRTDFNFRFQVSVIHCWSYTLERQPKRTSANQVISSLTSSCISHRALLLSLISLISYSEIHLTCLFSLMVPQFSDQPRAGEAFSLFNWLIQGQLCRILFT